METFAPTNAFASFFGLSNFNSRAVVWKHRHFATRTPDEKNAKNGQEKGQS